MPVIVIANPKGGVGKTTFATNLAGYFAAQSHAVMLGDSDVQQSSKAWLGLRSNHLPKITSWDVIQERFAKPPKGTTHVVLDTPAGLHGKKLAAVLKLADKVIVPLQASMFDILATDAFLKELAQHEKMPKMAVVGMRVNARTKAAEQLQHYVEQLGLPVLGYLRDTQNYVQLAAHGATLWDLAPSKVEKDIAQWQDILSWLSKK
jgi:chromosome partitioning protein